MAMNQDRKTKFYFFSGKGGVGKTTMACATAIHYADAGKKTLILTTDPASNLADTFEQAIGPEVVPIKGVPNLWAMELDPDKATADYKERSLAPLRGFLPQESLDVIAEQLNSPCTAEVATFERFTDFLQKPDYDIVIFDTAPTGHTLRLIQLPGEWSSVIENAAKDGSAGQTCVGPATALAESKIKFDRALQAMRNPDESDFVFVLRPEATCIYETKHSVGELQKLGINSQELIVNGVYPPSACDNPFMAHRYLHQQEFLREIKTTFALPARLIELQPSEVKGMAALRAMAKRLLVNPLNLKNYVPADVKACAAPQAEDYPKVDPKIRSLLTPKNGACRTLFFAGTGGVGKTSVAAATALWVAHQGYKTLLVTTDPASHLAEVFEQEVTDEPTLIKGEKNLWVAHIDPPHAAAVYKERVMSEMRGKYDAKRIKAIEEELDSPCTEEMATFEEFIDFASRKDFQVMIFDTAPTGHTIRLLKLPVDWSKQIEIKIYTNSESEADKATKSHFQEVISMMQDPARTTFSFVMYPESTPIEEAARAMEDLAGIGIKTGLVVANLILPDAILTNDYLKQRKTMQVKYLKEMEKRFEAPIVPLHLMTDDLMGKEKLAQAGLSLYGI
jgi:arsenite/tail-anchored protein-transporting ATPase